MRYRGIFVQKHQIIKTNKKHNDTLRVTVGDIVKINKFNCYGVVRFIGPTDIKPGTWYGIQLELPKGKNNGYIKQRRYFKCTPKHGIFLKSTQISLIKESTQTQRPEIISRDQSKIVDADFLETNKPLTDTKIWLYPMVYWSQKVQQYNTGSSELLAINFKVSNDALQVEKRKKKNKLNDEKLFLQSQNLYKQTLCKLLQPYVDIKSVTDIILLFHGQHLFPVRYSVDLMPYFYETVRLTKERKTVWNKAAKEYENNGRCTVDFTPDANIIVDEDIYDDFVSHIQNEFGLRKMYQENAVFYVPYSKKFLTVYATPEYGTNTIQDKYNFTRSYIESLYNFDTCKDYAFSMDLVGINYYYYRAPIVYDSGWGSRSRCWHGNGLVLLSDGSRKLIKYLNIGDEVAVLNSLPNGVMNEFETAIVKVKIESVINGLYDMVSVENKLWITPFHALVDRKINKWKMPSDGNKIEQKMVTSIFNFVLDRGHVICVNGIWACTLGHDLKGDIIENPIWGSSHVMYDMWSKFDGYPNVVEYI